MSNKNWLRDDIQFPRLIAELEAAGAFTEEVMTNLRDSMDLNNQDISDLVDRAQLAWEKIKGGDMSLTARQYAWIYLIENGNAGLKPSYYGGYDFTEDTAKRFPKINKWNHGEILKVKEAFLADIKRLGVDWSKTEEPDTGSFSQFTDTFHDPEYRDFMQGTLVLKDGTTQYWCGEKLEIQSAFQMMAMVDEAKQKFVDIFGEGQI